MRSDMDGRLLPAEAMGQVRITTEMTPVGHLWYLCPRECRDESSSRPRPAGASVDVRHNAGASPAAFTRSDMNVLKDKPKRRARKTRPSALVLWMAADLCEQADKMRESAQNLLAMVQGQRGEK